MKSELPTREEVKEVLEILERWCAAGGYANDPDGVVEKILKAYINGDLIPRIHELAPMMSEEVQQTLEAERILRLKYQGIVYRLCAMFDEGTRKCMVDMLEQKFKAEIDKKWKLYAEIERLKELSGKLPKQPCYGEDELLKMMPPEKKEGKHDCHNNDNSCWCYECDDAGNKEDFTHNRPYNQARKEIARALSGKLQKPRKVGRAKILDIITKAYYVDAQNTVEEYFERLADLIMKEIGDE